MKRNGKINGRRNVSVRGRRRVGRNLQGPPVAYRQVSRNTRPIIKRNTENRLPIKHREYIQPIKASTNNDFSIAATIPLNPGLSSSFPWLSSTARNYESYRVSALKVEYIPVCPTTTVGKVSMMIDYDCVDEPPTNNTQLQNSAGSVATQVWSNVNLFAEPEQMNKAYKSRYIRAGLAPPNTDLKTYDMGNLYVCIEGNSSAGTMGDLFISYDITLLTPQLNIAFSGGTDTQVFTTQTGVEKHPFLDATVTGVQLMTMNGTNPNWDSFRFNQPGYYLLNLLSPTLRASDGGIIGGGSTLTNKVPLYSTKSPTQGFINQFLAVSGQGGGFDLQGSGSTDPNQFKQNKLSVERLTQLDWANLRGLVAFQEDNDIHDEDTFEDFT